MDSRTGEGPIGLAFAALGHLILNSQLMYTLLGYVLRSLLGAERVRLTEIASGPDRVEQNTATWTASSQK